MRNLSIKLRVTIWYTVFVSVLTAVFMCTLIASTAKMSASMSKLRLANAVEWAAESVRYDKDGSLKFDPEISKAKGIDIIVYDISNTPVYKGKNAVELDTPFENNKPRLFESDNNSYFVYDRIIDFKHHDSLWVRGYLQNDFESITNASMIRLAFIIFPFSVIIMAIGGYIITKRAFKPVASITAQANAISVGNDLSKMTALKKESAVKDEISELSDTFDKMFKRLQASFEKERRFTSDVSHELRTPTSVILSQCEYLLSKESDSDKRESLEAILKQTEKMSRLISELLMLARTDNGKQAMHFENIDLSETFEMVIEELRFSGNDKNIEIISDIEPGIFIRADQALIMRMLINLISNGMQYGKENGYIKVFLHFKNDTAYGRISDNGIGISQEHLSKIWDRFFQSNPSRSNSGGSSGLGLPIVKWIVEQHDGCISVNSTLGEGTDFIFSLSDAYKSN